MKKILIVVFLFITKIGLCQSVSLSLIAPPGQPLNTDALFTVQASWGYAGITPGSVVTVKIDYDPTILSYSNCNSLDGSYTVIETLISPTVKRISISFLANSIGTKNDIVPVCFKFLCTQCFGVNFNTAVSGNIQAPSTSLFTSNTLSIAANQINNWSGVHIPLPFSYNSLTSEITYKLTASGNCFLINSPEYKLTLPAGTTLTSASGTISSANSFIPTPVNPWSISSLNTYYYTIKLPCGIAAGSTITTGAMLTTTNCTIAASPIITYPTAAFIIPSATLPNPHLTITNATPSTTNAVANTVTNDGNIPLKVILHNNLPVAKILSAKISYTQSTATSTIDWQGCSGGFTSNTFTGNPGTVPTPFTGANFATNTNITFQDLLPGHSFTIEYNYNLSNSCSGVPGTTDLVLTSTAQYQCPTVSTGTCNNCTIGTGSTTAFITTIPVTPKIYYQVSIPDTCYKIGDTATITLNLNNPSQANLIGGSASVGLPSFLTYLAGIDIYSGFAFSNPTYNAASAVSWGNVNINKGTGASITFKALVNSFAIAGGTGINGSCSYSNSGQMDGIQICQKASGVIKKEVQGSLDNSYSLTGSGTPGSNLSYKVTITNTGTMKMNNIVLVDRLPFVGDKRILDCAPRNSAFPVYPTAAFTIAGATIKYATIANINTGWSSSVVGCNTPSQLSSFGSTFPAFPPAPPVALLINLSTPILPGNTASFFIPAKIDNAATNNLQACNCIAMICDYVDNANNPLTAEPIESENACIKVVSQNPPCNCQNNDCNVKAYYTILPSTAKIDLKCNTQIDIPCNQPISFAADITCPTNCTATLNETLTDASGNILATQTNVSSTSPLNYTFTTNGTYTLTGSVIVNGVVCKTCEVKIIVNCQIDCCKGSYWKQEPVIKTNTGIPIGKFSCKFPTPFVIDKKYCNQDFDVAGTFICADTNCIANVVYSLYNSSGGLVNTSNNLITIPASLANGNYTLVVQAYCNDILCSECKFEIKKDCVLQPPSPCKNCDVKISNSSTISTMPNTTLSGTELIQSFSFTGTGTVVSVRATVEKVNIYAVDANGKKSDLCLKCINNPISWGSLINATGISVPATVLINGLDKPVPFSPTQNQNPREITWANSGSIFNISSPLQLHFLLPPKSSFSCCTLKATICVKFTFRNDKCEECSVIKCFESEIK